MKVKKLTLTSADFPEVLKGIPSAPRELFVMGNDLEELLVRPCVTIVGSRKVSTYGRAVTATLAGDLAQAGVVVVSGLAMGVDAIAHRAALEVGGLTIAVLPSGLDNIYPASHRQLAARIMEQGGALLSEYPFGTTVYPVNFIARNRIASGLSSAVLITEAAKKSGTLHTARFALEQGKDVLAVPGNITSPTSEGTNNLIKAGATPVTEVADIFHVIGVAPGAVRKRAPQGSTPAEQAILDLLYSGVSDGSVLLARSTLEVTSFNQALTMLEIEGRVRSLGGNTWSLI